MNDDISIRSAIRDRFRALIERWERIVTYQTSSGDDALAESVLFLHRLRSALDVLRSRAHRQYVSDAWLQEREGKPASDIVTMIEAAVPEGFPDPPVRAPRLGGMTDTEARDVLSGRFTASPRAVAEAARQLGETGQDLD